MKITVKYKAGHSYDENWGKTAFFCPACGAQSVWCEAGAGDYYVGEQYLCVTYTAGFYLPGGAYAADDDRNSQRLEALKQ